MDTIKKNLLNVYVINLKKDVYKKQKILKYLKTTMFSYKFIEATDAANLTTKDYKNYNDYLRKLFMGKSLIDKEIAIFNSHLSVLREIVALNLPLALVLEDDVSIPKIFENTLNEIIKINYKWDLIRFIGPNKFSSFNGRKVLKINKTFSLQRFPKLPGGAHAYLISNNGAKKIIEQCKGYYLPFDILIGQTWRRNINCLYLKPGLISQATINNELMLMDPRLIKVPKKINSIYFFSRATYKLYESFFKMMHYLIFFFPDKYAYFRSKHKQ
ncbi:MAG: glycosyltransferase family 25 protein [Candidatus Pelagibacter sp.]|nr:glycosyltransferase family 25 protein [Candidatus Pelagibacter sp.]